MTLNKEMILTLTCLKEVGVKGIGPQKIFSIARTINDNSIEVKTYEDLASIMSSMKEKAIHTVTLDDMNNANQYALKIVDASEKSNIGYVGFYDEEFPDLLRHTT